MGACLKCIDCQIQKPKRDMISFIVKTHTLVNMTVNCLSYWKPYR